MQQFSRKKGLHVLWKQIILCKNYFWFNILLLNRASFKGATFFCVSRHEMGVLRGNERGNLSFTTFFPTH